MQKKSFRASAALLALAFTTLSSSASSPMLASIGADFPEVPSLFLSMLSTVPSLICVPVALICGRIAGKRVPFRSLLLFGMAITFLSGIGPFFSRSFYFVLAWRCLFGIGLGLLSPLLNALTLLLFDKEKARTQAGSNTMSTNVGAIVFQLGAGLLCSYYNWRIAFLIYVLILPCMIIAWAFLPEPSSAPLMAVQEASPSPKRTDGSRHGLRPVYPWCLLYFLYCLLFYSLVTETSSVIMKSGFGTAGTAGIVLALFTAGGVAGGFLFRKLSHLEYLVFALSFGMMGVGFSIMILASSILPFTAGEILVGIGFGIFIPAVNTTGGLAVPMENRSKAASILVVWSNLGSFLSAFFLSALSRWLGKGEPRFPFFISMSGFFLLALWFLLLAGRKRRMAADENGR